MTVGGSDGVIRIFDESDSFDAVALGRIRSGNGAVGAVPNLYCLDSLVADMVVVAVVVVEVVDDNSVVIDSVLSKLPDPVEPTRVTELRFDGDDGPLRVLSVNVSKLLDVAMVVAGMDNKLSDCEVVVVISIAVTTSCD